MILGILSFNPSKEANDVKSIGPKNQARGIFKNSANNAPGMEIKITHIKFLDIISLKFIKLSAIPVFSLFHVYVK